MEWLQEAHEELTERPVPELSLRYSGRFKGFNANVKYSRRHMEFRLSKDWQEVDTEIQKGLVQHLLCRVYGLKTSTMAIEMYEEFLRQASEYAPKGESDAYLVERFWVLNEEYFSGMLAEPTIEWGQFSTTKLGSYEYATDTIRISRAMADEQDMLDYVLYHEMLHKKHKFTCSDGRTHHHTKTFKQDEARFRVPDAEKRLQRYVARQRRKKRATTPRSQQKRSWWPW